MSYRQDKYVTARTRMQLNNPLQEWRLWKRRLKKLLCPKIYVWNINDKSICRLVKNDYNLKQDWSFLTRYANNNSVAAY